ncbi:hypothetical protein KCU61_g731, partial [Aureobasidium melanogenum]
LRRKVGHDVGGSVAGDGRRGVGSLVDKTSKPMHQPECETIQSSRLDTEHRLPVWLIRIRIRTRLPPSGCAPPRVLERVESGCCCKGYMEPPQVTPGVCPKINLSNPNAKSIDVYAMLVARDDFSREQEANTWKRELGYNADNGAPCSKRIVVYAITEPPTPTSAMPTAANRSAGVTLS